MTWETRGITEHRRPCTSWPRSHRRPHVRLFRCSHCTCQSLGSSECAGATLPWCFWWRDVVSTTDLWSFRKLCGSNGGGVNYILLPCVFGFYPQISHDSFDFPLPSACGRLPSSFSSSGSQPSRLHILHLPSHIQHHSYQVHRWLLILVFVSHPAFSCYLVAPW